MLKAEDMTRAQLEKPQNINPIWNGIILLELQICFQRFKTHQEYLDFYILIDKIGMNSMVVETDMAGNYVGSSYGWATTRDWAKFGLLYLHKGTGTGTSI
jgi:hypothetical protein